MSDLLALICGGFPRTDGKIGAADRGGNGRKPLVVVFQLRVDHLEFLLFATLLDVRPVLDNAKLNRVPDR